MIAAFTNQVSGEPGAAHPVTRVRSALSHNANGSPSAVPP